MSVGSGSVGSHSVGSQRVGTPPGATPQVIITTGPSNVDALAVMSPSPVVTLTTDGSTTDTSYNGSVICEIFTGAGNVLSGGTVTAVNGVATFPALKSVGGAVTYRFRAGGYTSVVSSSVTINQILTRTFAVPTFTPLYNSVAVQTGGTGNLRMVIPVNYNPAVSQPIVHCWPGSGNNFPGAARGVQMTSPQDLGVVCAANLATWPYISLFYQYDTTVTGGGTGNVGNALTWQQFTLAMALLAADGITPDLTRQHLYGFSEGGWMVTEALVAFPNTYASAVLAETWASPFRIKAISASVNPGNVDGTADDTSSASAVLSANLALAMWQFVGTADSQLTGAIAPADTVKHATDIQSPIWLSGLGGTLYTLTTTGLGHLPGGIDAAARFDTPASAGQLWWAAQLLGVGGGGGGGGAGGRRRRRRC